MQNSRKLIVSLLSLPAGILKAWVVLTMWGWFIVPTFGLPALNVPIVYGILIAVAYIKGYPDTEYDEDYLSKVITNFFILPFIVLGFGWVALQFV